MTISLLEPIRYRRLVKARLADLDREAIRARVCADRDAALRWLYAEFRDDGFESSTDMGDAELVHWVGHCRDAGQKDRAA